MTKKRLPDNDDYVQFALVYLTEDNFQIQAPGGLYSEGLNVGGIFGFQILYMEGLIFGIFTVFRE